jgi:hypothetical protein
MRHGMLCSSGAYATNPGRRGSVNPLYSTLVLLSYSTGIRSGALRSYYVGNAQWTFVA